ncbi:hypothetical protein [Kitasatospora sp. NPDC002965]|uniref:hypothetical protein n=1 Tax=Kitasatospora sp. NPDC002965 TaxID=3154775 RepID=UPI0033A84C90
MKITIEGASEEFERRLLDLVAEHRHELLVTADTEWTVQRAERYLRSLPASARRFAEIVVIDGDGYADADTLRSSVGKLNGPTVGLSRAIGRGVREGWWPEGTAAPITVVYDPDNPSWQRAIAYEMTSENVPVFRTAIAQLAVAKGISQSLGLIPGGPTTVGRRVIVPASDLVDLDGGSRPADANQDDNDQPRPEGTGMTNFFDNPQIAIGQIADGKLLTASLEAPLAPVPAADDPISPRRRGKTVALKTTAEPASQDEPDEDDGVMECHVCFQPYESDEENNLSHLDTTLDADHTPRS